MAAEQSRDPSEKTVTLESLAGMSTQDKTAAEQKTQKLLEEIDTESRLRSYSEPFKVFFAYMILGRYIPYVISCKSGKWAIT